MESNQLFSHQLKGDLLGLKENSMKKHSHNKYLLSQSICRSESGCGLAVLCLRISHKNEPRCWPGLQLLWNARLQEESRPSVLTWLLAEFSSSRYLWTKAFSSLLRIQVLAGCWLETSLSSLTFKARRTQFCPGVGTWVLMNCFVRSYLRRVKIIGIAFVFLVRDWELKSRCAHWQFSSWYAFVVCI